MPVWALTGDYNETHLLSDTHGRRSLRNGSMGSLHNQHLFLQRQDGHMHNVLQFRQLHDKLFLAMPQEKLSLNKRLLAKTELKGILFVRSRRFDCKWMYDYTDITKARCCGEPVIGTGSWCEEHRGLVYRNAQQKDCG